MVSRVWQARPSFCFFGFGIECCMPPRRLAEHVCSTPASTDVWRPPHSRKYNCQCSERVTSRHPAVVQCMSAKRTVPQIPFLLFRILQYFLTSCSRALTTSSVDAEACQRRGTSNKCCCCARPQYQLTSTQRPCASHSAVVQGVSAKCTLPEIPFFLFRILKYFLFTALRTSSFVAEACQRRRGAF